MRRRDRDFVALYNALWYKDFPVTPERGDINRRAVWTTHIASTVKQTADLLGLYTSYESGGKTDAVIEDGSRRRWARVEWEWDQPYLPSVNEIEKLRSAINDASTFMYIGYSRIDKSSMAQMNLEKIGETWGIISSPLIVFLVTFSRAWSRRSFHDLETHLFQRGRHTILRRQPALPWAVNGTKWAAREKP